MFTSKYIFTFVIVTFFLLSITGAGIFVDDEWVSAQQLKQLGSGHQIITNEGTYGYYANGTSGNYFTSRHNLFMYTMALPIVSLPIYEIIKLSGDENSRIIFIAIWGLLGVLLFQYLYNLRKITKKYMAIGIGMISILMLLNVLLYNNFPISGKFNPPEVLAIVFTNIILFGLFAVTIQKIIDILFDDNTRFKLFAFITILSCTSLIFWVGNCKDHVLTVLITTTILYLLIKYEQEKSMTSLSLALFLTGLLAWVRIEIGAGMLIGISGYLLLFHFKNILSNKWVLSISLLIGSIPLWINNYISTGSPLIHPFTVASTEVYSITPHSQEDIIAAKIIADAIANPLWTPFHTLFSPASGAVALLVIIPLVAIIIPAYILKRVKLSQTDILLLFVAFGSSIYYIIVSTKFMHADTGIMPDLRYFIFFYTAITLFMLSIFYKIKPDLNYKKITMYIILATGLLFILFSAYSGALSERGTYRDLNKVVNTLGAITMGVGIIAVINDIRLNKNYLTYILPIMIAIPLAWQLVMLFIYHTSKTQSYPMFIPITEFVYNYLFGLLL
jgi:hypothetical protein